MLALPFPVLRVSPRRSRQRFCSPLLARGRDPDAESFRADDDEPDRELYIPKASFAPLASAEHKAAEALKQLLTFAAVRVIIGQAAPEAELLQAALPVGRDAAAWLREILRRPDLEARSGALRVLQVRSALAANVFDWEVVRSLTVGEMEAEAISMRVEMLETNLAKSGGAPEA